MNLRSFWKFWDRAGIFLILSLLVSCVAITNEDFRRPANLPNLLLQSAPIGFAAIGMTLAIVSGAFDLSVGSIMGLTACVFVSLIESVGFIPALGVALALGAALGYLNGSIITRIGINPFITTLGTMWVFRSFAFIYTKNQPLSAQSAVFFWLGEPFLGVPRLFFLMLLAYGLAYLILYWTSFGRSLFAVGSNERAARLSGISVDRVKRRVFACVGLFGALGGTALAVRLQSAKADTALGTELIVIAAVVLGGTSLRGGSGTLAGTLGAALLFAVVYNALDMFEVQSYWQRIALGGILLAALALDGLRKWREKR